LLDVSKANTFITHSYLFVCLLLYYKRRRMGIFFVLKQNCPAKQTGQVLKHSNQSKIQARPHRLQEGGK